MYFDFEDYRPDVDRIGSPISRREGVLLSIIGHLLALLLFLFGPQIPFIQRALEEQAAQQAERIRQLELEQQRQAARRFVFVAPRVDPEAPRPPEIADFSDKDRLARAPERSPTPTNPLPFARGNSPEMVEADRQALARGRGPVPDPAAGLPNERGGESEALSERPSVVTDAGRTGFEAPAPDPGARAGAEGRASTQGGSLGEALRNLERFTRSQTFGNAQGGGGEFGPYIQFDTKGVEFGPWIRRFIAQVKRNWFIPYAAMALKGHAVLTFNVHRDGSITDLAIAQPSSVDAFNNAAFNALALSNPTQPLPPEYPVDRAFFTVTFYYNETPPSP